MDWLELKIDTSPAGIEAVTELLEEQGKMYGNQALLVGLFSWRGPGTNIHRSPFNGRTFEYYSEDPFLTSSMAAVIVDG